MKLSLAKLGYASFVLLAACSGGTEPGEIGAPAESDEAALTTRQIPDVAAIEFEFRTAGPGNMNGRPTVTKKTIGAKAKIAKVMRGLKKKTDRDPVPLCHPGSTRTQLKFLNDKSEVIATGGYTCMMGSVTLPNGDNMQIMARTSLIDDALDAPLVPADALWGITKVTINKFARVGTAPPGEVTVEHEEGVGKILDAMSVEQKIEPPSGLNPHCRPTHSIGFLRKDKEVAFSTYVCHLTEIPTELVAKFTIVDPGNEEAEALAEGRIKINPRAIEDVYEAGLPVPAGQR